MSPLLVVCSVALVTTAAWLGVRRQIPLAGFILLAALVPLLFDVSVTKSVFIWLGLTGPIFALVVVMKGLQRASD